MDLDHGLRLPGRQHLELRGPLRLDGFETDRCASTRRCSPAATAGPGHIGVPPGAGLI
ncbi:hypothetical protein [Actinoplanes philippinensis]|uniref:hypothetical protein n=1 Tax=Actinoplanes philippinensis TaxID=35752 RepID=UPI0033ED291D